jgi:hypothetical protein
MGAEHTSYIIASHLFMRRVTYFVSVVSPLVSQSSRFPMSSEPVASTSLNNTADLAPEHPLPHNHFYSVEYPGYVRPTSVPLAVRNLGGQASLENVFRRTTSKSSGTVELNLRPDNPFTHPIPGELVGTNNLLLKVVKRRRKRREGEEATGANTDEIVGEYTAEVVGVVPKTVRFRSELVLSFSAGVILKTKHRRHG